MFDIDAGKLLIIGVIALVVLGPKELPRVLRQVGAIIGKMRRMAGEFQTQFMDAMKESEMEELKKDVQKIADQARVDINYDPVSTTDREIRDAIDGRKPDAKPDAKPAATTPAADPDNAIYTVDIPPPPATPDAAAVVSAEHRPEPAPAAAPEATKKSGEA
jgi:sec-independent protein translocase protein TatB